MTRRREVPVLAFTVREAAQAIRLSEHTMRDWIRAGIVRVVRWNSLDLVPRVELDRLINDAMDNDGEPVAYSTVSPAPAGLVETVEYGADSPSADSIDRPGPASKRHAASTSTKTGTRPARRVPSTASGRGRTVPAGHAGSKDQ